jgi:hypothetical protein
MLRNRQATGRPKIDDIRRRPLKTWWTWATTTIWTRGSRSTRCTIAGVVASTAHGVPFIGRAAGCLGQILTRTGRTATTSWIPTHEVTVSGFSRVARRRAQRAARKAGKSPNHCPDCDCADIVLDKIVSRNAGSARDPKYDPPAARSHRRTVICAPEQGVMYMAGMCHKRKLI